MSELQCVQINDKICSKAALLIYTVLEGELGGLLPCPLDTFQTLVEDLPNINYVFPANNCLKQSSKAFLIGNTLLHVLHKTNLIYSCSIMYLNTLLDRDIDFTKKNSKGNTVLHKIVKNDLKDTFILCYNGRRWQYATSVLFAHICRGISTNPCNKNGLTHFHIACMLNHVPAVQFFLKRGISVNEAVNNDSPMLAGFTALHFAVNYYALDVAKVLLQHNININAKDARGVSPLYILIQKKLRIYVTLMAMKKTNPKKSSNELEMKYKKIDEMIMLITKNNTMNLMESLHALCTMQDTSMIVQFLDSKGTCQLNCQLGSDMPMWHGYSALHFAAHFSIDMVQLLVEKGAQLGLRDAKGVTPFEICLQRFRSHEILNILERQPTRLSLETNLPTLITRNEFSKYNSDSTICMDSLCTGYTPLHFAITITENPKDYWNVEYHSSFEIPRKYLVLEDNYPKESEMYLEKVKSCLKSNPDVTAQNASGSTPLHLAFQLQESHAVHLLLENHTKIVNPIDANNLSHLHIACAAKDEALVKKLLVFEKNVNIAVASKYMWYVTKASCQWKTPLFMSKGSTALHYAAIVGCPQIVKLLIENGADILMKDYEGFNPLERMLNQRIFGNTSDEFSYMVPFCYTEEDKIKVIELLLRQLAKVIVDTTDGLNRILRYYSVLLEQELNYILSSDDLIQNRIFESVGITPLHLACQRKNWVQVCRLLENGASVNAQVSANSPLWPGKTPLHISVYQNANDYIEVLLYHGADVTIADANHQTPLHMVSICCLKRPYEVDVETSAIVNLLLSHHKDFAVNPVSAEGLSHFHVACFTGNVRFVEKFIKHDVDVNQATDYFFNEYGGYSSLHFAAHFLRSKVVDLLLAHGADIHYKAIGEKNALHSAVSLSRTFCKDTIASLIRAGVNINAKNTWGEVPLETLLCSPEVRREEVDLYIKQNCRVNYYNSISKRSLLALALKRDSEGKEIFDDVIKVADITDINEDGRNAIHNVVSFYTPCWDVYEEIAGNIEETFIPVRNYISAIEKFVTLGLNIDHQEHKGATPLHIAVQRHNINGVIGLLSNGADINLIDNKHKTAYANNLELALRHGVGDTQRNYELLALKFFSKHIYKLNFLNLEVSELNIEIDAATRTLVDIRYDSTLKICRAELETSKNQQIGPATLYDFMSETGVVSSYLRMFDLNRQIIDTFFKDNVNFLHREFPSLAGLACLQYRKAKTRVGLIKSATDSIKFLVQYDIPLLCTDIILKFLSNTDIKNIITAAFE